MLGCLLIGGNELGALDECQATLPPEAFYDLRHQTIYRVIMTMHGAGLPCDATTIGMWLSDDKELDRVGGYTYLSALQDCAASPELWDYFRGEVRTKFTLRTIVQRCTAIVSKVYESGDFEVAEVAELATRELNQIGESLSVDTSVGMEQIIPKTINTIEALHQRQGQFSGLASGLSDLDKLTQGFQNSEVFVLAGRPGTGKSSLALNIADNIAVKLHVPVGVFSMEMSAESLGLRAVCARGRVNLRNVQEGFLAERDFPKITTSAGALHHSPLRIDAQAGVTIVELRAKARMMHRKYGTRFFVIDYLQLMAGGEKRYTNRQEEVSEISKGVKRLAMDLNVPILLLSQLNRSMEKESRRPRLSDLRESGSIEQDADTVGLLYVDKKQMEDDNEAYDLDAVPVNLEIAKQRNGPTGTIHLMFLRPYTRFEDCAKITDANEPPEQQTEMPMT